MTRAATAAKRSSRSLLTSWLTTPNTKVQTTRANARDNLTKTMVATWAGQAAGRRVSPRASMRESHSSALLSSWAAESGSREVQKRAISRERVLSGLLTQWLVKEGVSKQTPKDAVKRGPLPATALASRWLIQDGLSRVGSESAVDMLQHGVRGMYPVNKGDLLRSWWEQGMGAEARRVMRIVLGLGAGLLVAAAVAEVGKEASNARARKLMRRGSLAGARLTKKLSLR